jgi:hypothetical protein
MVIGCIAGPAVLAATASNVDRGCEFAWGENIGWLNWRDAQDGAAGAVIDETFLSGFVWGENVGWINLGDGAPANGAHYSNTDGADSGVNIAPDGDLFGLAWGENIGWVSFDTRSRGDQRARVDREARRLRGYAWGENVGWINLDDPTHAVRFHTARDLSFLRGDSNADGRVNVADPVHVLRWLFLDGPVPPCLDATDANDSGAHDISDAVAILVYLFAGVTPPAPGLSTCGVDASDEDGIDCLSYSPCP